MPLFTAKEPIRYNGEDFAPGDTVEMSAKDAKPLVASGDIEPQAAETAKKK